MHNSLAIMLRGKPHHTLALTIPSPPTNTIRNVSKKLSVQCAKSSHPSFHKHLPSVGLRDPIDYKDVSLICQFISEQGK
jgi:ribosomal protein S18